MYCSSCGVAVPKDLSYCNHCGAVLDGVKRNVPRPGELLPDSLVWAIVGVFATGLASIIGLTAVLKNYGLNDGVVLAFMSLIFLMMLVVEAVFIGLLMRKTGSREVKGRGRLKQPTTRELEGAQPRTLAEPVASVTEHTTRAFEPIYRERKTE